MRIELQSTDVITTVNGVPARLWVGVSGGGVRCHAYITRIGVDMAADAGEFERELTEVSVVLPEDLEGIPMRLII